MREGQWTDITDQGIKSALLHAVNRTIDITLPVRRVQVTELSEVGGMERSHLSERGSLTVRE